MRADTIFSVDELDSSLKIIVWRKNEETKNDESVNHYCCLLSTEPNIATTLGTY